MLLLAAAAFNLLANYLTAERAPLLVNAAFVLIVLALLGWLNGKVVSNGAQDYGQARTLADRIRPLVPIDSTLIVVDPLYLRLYDYPNVVEMNVGLFIAQRDHIDEQTAWARIGASAIVILRDYPIPPPESLLDYVQENGFVRVHCWDSQRIGHADLYVKTPTADITSVSACDRLD